MICPNCKAEISDDKLYCEKCGTEFQIVPDMDVDFEVGMDNTLSGIAKQEFGSDDEFDDMEYDDDPTILGLLLKNKKTGWIFYVVLGVILLFLIIAATKLGKNMSRESSKEYQLEKAEEALTANDLTKAIEHLSLAYKADKSDYNILFDIADYYYSLSRNDDALFTLKDISLNKEFTYDVRENAYKKMISLYKSEERYEEIKDLLIDCDLSSITSEYIEYAAPAPVFSLNPGTYSETLALKLNVEGDGKIHYTLDGSLPTVSSDVYDSPIFLEYGSYEIKAVFENNYGVLSDVSEGKYLIDVAFSFEPSVLTESGSYNEATLIEVEVPVMYTVFYTDDGTDPDKTSNKYVYPFAMPLGESEYKFVSYASDGTMSDIVTVNYSLTLKEGTVSPAEAVDTLVAGLVERGFIDSTSGTKEGLTGHYLYMYVAPYPIEGVGDVYFVVEYYEDSVGNISKTNKTYGINCVDKTLYTVSSLGQGAYSVTPF